MKLCVSTYCFEPWQFTVEGRTLDHVFEQIAAMGVGAVEVVYGQVSPSDDRLAMARSLRTKAASLGLKIVSYCTRAELLVPAEAQAKVVAELKREVDFAAALGALTMRHDVTHGFDHKNFAQHWPGQTWTKPRTDEAVREHVAPAIREVAAYAVPIGLKTSFENHGFYLQTAERVEKLVQAVNHPNFGITLDLGNFLCVDENPVDAVATLARYTVMAHAKDFLRDTVKRDDHFWPTPKGTFLCGTVLGTGDVDTAKQLQLLSQAGYNGYLSLEYEAPGDAHEGIKAGLEFLRTQLKKINALD